MKLPMLLDMSNGELQDTHTGFELIRAFLGWVLAPPWGVSLLMGLFCLIVCLRMCSEAWYVRKAKGTGFRALVFGALMSGGVGLFFLLSTSYPV